MRKFLQLIEEVRKVDPRAADFLESKDARKIRFFKEKENINDCFLWVNAPQGHEYWRKIAEAIPQPYGWKGDKRRVKRVAPNVGEILQKIYDSEINLSLGWLWDGGIDYAVGQELSSIKVAEIRLSNVISGDISLAILQIADDVCREYPGSMFAKWWKENK